ncbi:putative cytochrome p450 protein [Botrytis fragariae]|uniref:Putative cytochrome p450 protein n=1 Tax=Botrytis fragariae TaxID=1964551 RepID=A0A8H6EMW7_9HELO|nr:putative cytochrome p450 protein [Botrytis fragariae]KAF5877740.1 putative cytochrome p450 protein [Botrytis fragariae]
MVLHSTVFFFLGSGRAINTILGRSSLQILVMTTGCPIIRINPNEIHIDDPYFFEEVFNQSNGRTQKPLNVAEAFGPYPAVHLCLYQSTTSSQESNVLSSPLRSTLGGKQPDKLLREDFGRKSFDDVDNFLVISLLNNGNKILAPAMADILDCRKDLSKQVESIRHEHEVPKSRKLVDKAVFHELLESKLQLQEMERDRLRDEALSLVTAGSGTTGVVSVENLANNCLLFLYPQSTFPQRNLISHLGQPWGYSETSQGAEICHPKPFKTSFTIRIRKTAVLDSCHPRRASSCRSSYPPYWPTVSRKPFIFHGEKIPTGTIVSTTTLPAHQNKNIFPESMAFKPERWLGNEDKKLERYLVPFNRGTRSCLGINLARAELYLILSSVYRRFDFDVSQVNRARGIDASRDYILGAQARDIPGILVKLRETD